MKFIAYLFTISIIAMCMLNWEEINKPSNPPRSINFDAVTYELINKDGTKDTIDMAGHWVLEKDGTLTKYGVKISENVNQVRRIK